MPKANKDQGRNEVTKNKIHKHLMDINDQITEKDIANVSTSDSATYGDLNKEEKRKVNKEVRKVTSTANKKNKKNKEDGNNEPDIETSWNILS